jgi:hypothetical protein
MFELFKKKKMIKLVQKIENSGHGFFTNINNDFGYLYITIGG